MLRLFRERVFFKPCIGGTSRSAAVLLGHMLNASRSFERLVDKRFSIVNWCNKNVRT